MHPRTKRQKEVLDYITSFIDRNGHEPSYQQIARHLGVSSRAGIQRHIAALEEQGLLARRRDNGGFGIDLPLKKIVSDLVCGIELIEVNKDESEPTVATRSVITLSRDLIGWLSPDEVFAFRCVDDSLTDRHICEDDIVILEKRSYARRGSVVLIKTADEHFRLGLYYQQGPETEIRPANSEYEPIVVPADEISVQGVMRGLLRYDSHCSQ